MTLFDVSWSSGKRGIRTPGPVKVNGFQDRRVRPLRHLSVCKDTTFLLPACFFDKKTIFLALAAQSTLYISES